MKIEIDIKDSATPALREVAAQIAPGGPMIKALGRSLANTLKAHFRARNADSPNKLGGKRTNFWSAVAATVQNPVIESDGVSVAVSHPHILQKYKGGKIVPGPGKKYLAIPVHQAAYGRVPADFKLAFIPKLGGPNITGGYLVDGYPRIATRGKKKGKQVYSPIKGGRMLFVLRGWVTQEADEKTLPSTDLILKDLEKAARIALGGQGPA